MELNEFLSQLSSLNEEKIDRDDVNSYIEKSSDDTLGRLHADNYLPKALFKIDIVPRSSALFRKAESITKKHFKSKIENIIHVSEKASSYSKKDELFITVIAVLQNAEPYQHDRPYDKGKAEYKSDIVTISMDYRGRTKKVGGALNYEMRRTTKGNRELGADMTGIKKYAEKKRFEKK